MARTSRRGKQQTIVDDQQGHKNEYNPELNGHPSTNGLHRTDPHSSPGYFRPPKKESAMPKKPHLMLAPEVQEEIGKLATSIEATPDATVMLAIQLLKLKGQLLAPEVQEEILKLANSIDATPDAAVMLAIQVLRRDIAIRQTDAQIRALRVDPEVRAQAQADRQEAALAVTFTRDNLAVYSD